MTKSEVTRLVALLRAAWPRQEIQRETLEVYAMALGDLDFEPCRAAVAALVQTARFFPTVAEIRERVAEARTNLPPVEIAWGEVVREIGRSGLYATPSFSCREIAEAVRVIGWRDICTDENVAATRARFTDAYRALRGRRMVAEVTGRYVEPERQLERPAQFALPAPDDRGGLADPGEVREQAQGILAMLANRLRGNGS